MNFNNIHNYKVLLILFTIFGLCLFFICLSGIFLIPKLCIVVLCVLMLFYSVFKISKKDKILALIVFGIGIMITVLLFTFYITNQNLLLGLLVCYTSSFFIYAY